MPTVPGRKKNPGNEARRSGNRACIRAAGNRSGHRQTASRPSRITRTDYRIRRHWLYCTLSARRQNRLSLHTRSPTPKGSRLLIVAHDPAVCRSDLRNPLNNTGSSPYAYNVYYVKSQINLISRGPPCLSVPRSNHRYQLTQQFVLAASSRSARLIPSSTSYA